MNDKDVMFYSWLGEVIGKGIAFSFVAFTLYNIISIISR